MEQYILHLQTAQRLQLGTNWLQPSQIADFVKPAAAMTEPPRTEPSGGCAQPGVNFLGQRKTKIGSGTEKKREIDVGVSYLIVHPCMQCVGRRPRGRSKRKRHPGGGVGCAFAGAREKSERGATNALHLQRGTIESGSAVVSTGSREASVDSIDVHCGDNLEYMAGHDSAENAKGGRGHTQNHVQTQN